MSKIATITVETVASLAARSTEELVSYVQQMLETGRAAYLNATKAIVALSEKMGESAAKTALKKAGVKDSTIKNAMQLVWVWNDAVKTGAASEDWFNSVNFMRAVAFRAAVAKLARSDASGVKALQERKLLTGTETSWREIESIAETGKTLAQQAEAESKAKSKAAESEKDEAEGKSTESSTEKKPANPLAEIESAAQALTELVVAYAPKADEVAAEKVANRLTALADAWAAARKATASRRAKSA